MTFFNESDLAACWTVNFAALRVQVLERLLAEPGAQFTRLERQAVFDRFVAAARQHARNVGARGPACRKPDWRDNAGLVILSRDLEELPGLVPKWVLLFGWLAPESAAAHCPDLVAAIALEALAGTLGKPVKRSPARRRRNSQG